MIDKMKLAQLEMKIAEARILIEEARALADELGVPMTVEVTGAFSREEAESAGWSASGTGC